MGPRPTRGDDTRTATKEGVSITSVYVLGNLTGVKDSPYHYDLYENM